MFAWEEWELQLAILQILLQAKLKQGEAAASADFSKTPPAQKPALRAYYEEIGKGKAFIKLETMANILQLKTDDFADAIKFLTTNELIESFKAGYKITDKGSKFIIDELNRPR